jgi:hypothetical protein
VSGGKVFSASVPDNWTSINAASTIKVVPQNGYGPVNGETAFTHGVEFGVLKAETRDLREATNAWLNALARTNPDMRMSGAQQSTQLSQRSAIVTSLVNPSPLGGQERIVVSTTFLADGTLFYYLAIAPEREAEQFQDAFQRIGASIRLTEVR